jgi:hypothetical protein
MKPSVCATSAASQCLPHVESAGLWQMPEYTFRQFQLERWVA